MSKCLTLRNVLVFVTHFKMNKLFSLDPNTLQTYTTKNRANLENFFKYFFLSFKNQIRLKMCKTVFSKIAFLLLCAFIQKVELFRKSANCNV